MWYLSHKVYVDIWKKRVYKLNWTEQNFVCTFDPFDRDYYRYDIQNQCVNVENLDYDDGNHTIFLNTKGQHGDISDYLKNFLKAVEGKFDSNKISNKIKEDIEILKTNENLEGKYMNF